MMPAGYMPSTTSLKAYKRLKGSGALTEREEAVLGVIKEFGPGGCIFDQVQEKLPHLPNSVSGRFLSLERKGWIVRTGATRPGRTGNQQKVMWHRDYAVSPPPLIESKKRKNPYYEGMLSAAKVLAAAPDKGTAMTELITEMRRIAARSAPK